MGLFSNMLHGKKAAAATDDAHSGSPSSPFRHIPSFNDFLGDTPAPEAAAEGGVADDMQAAVDRVQAATSPTSQPHIKPDIWRSTFDPGSNPNMHRVGKQFYDSVSDRKRAPTTWDYILQAEKAKASFDKLDRGRKGYIDESDLKAAFDSKYGDTKDLLNQADTDNNGHISRREYDFIVGGGHE